MLFDADKIKSASIDYLKDLLQNREPKKEYENDLNVVKFIHEHRMSEQVQDDDTFTDEDFGQLLKKLNKKNKNKYKFILKAGTCFLRCLFRLFKLVWEKEQKPVAWENTVAHQLFKGKGKISRLSNYRFIHTKEEIPKAFEHIVITKAKPKIVSGCSKFQIGALPSHQSQEHLFTLKSIMLWYETLKIPIIIQLYDISKFFDRENLKDGMNALYSCGINGKLYRMIFEMNRKTQLRVKTGVGMSDSAKLGENITQGSIGGALISTVNLDYTVNNHFRTSNHEISYVSSRLQPLIFQDDLCRMCSSPSDAQAGNMMIESCMESKLLDLNTDKSCYIVIGSDKSTAKIKSELKDNPLILCGDQMKQKVNDKYLGDYLHCHGTEASVSCTISNRQGRTSLSIIESRAIIDDCRINTVGGLMAGIDIWEMAVLPSLLNNCQTWVNISETSIKNLENLQNDMYRTLLAVPRTSPLPSLCWDFGGIQMRFRIIMKKLDFLWHLVNLENDTLAKEILTVQKDHNLPGLVSECTEWIQTYDLPNIMQEKITKPQWKSKVKAAILKANENDLRSKMMKYEKLKSSDLVEESFGTKPYLKNLSVHQARIIFKKRVSMMQHVKMNYMSDMNYMKCMRLCAKPA